MDFNKKWNEYLDLSNKGINHYDDRKQAKSYYMSKKIIDDGVLRSNKLKVEKSWTGLDIGSGPGVMTVPLAKRIKHMTAVEPSESMIEFLNDYKKRKGIENISIINKKWEDVETKEIKKYDIVIASYSLNMRDIKDALWKMNEVATKKVYLYWFAGTTSWEKLKIDLLPLVKNTSYQSFLKCDYIINTLSSLDIYPDIKVLDKTSFSREFNSMKDAINDLRNRLDISDNNYDSLLENYIIENYSIRDDKIVFIDNTTYVEISWTPKKTNII